MKELSKQNINIRFFATLIIAAMCFVVGYLVYPKSTKYMSVESVKILSYFSYFSFFLVVPFVLLAFKLRKDNRVSYSYNQTHIQNNITGEKFAFGDLQDIHYMGESAQEGIDFYGGVALRKNEQNPWLILAKRDYKTKDVGELVAFYNQARTQQALEEIKTGKTLRFHFIPYLEGFKNNNLYGVKANLSVKTKPVLLSKNELIFEDTTYQISDLQAIGNRDAIVGRNGVYYKLKSKEGKTIFSFEKFDLMSYQVFLNVMNEIIAV